MFKNTWLVDVGFVVKAATDGARFKLDYLAARSFLEKRLGRTDAYEPELARAQRRGPMPGPRRW